jgi:protein-disulfide isomerase
MIELLEYGDFECPYCRDAAPAVRKVLDRMGDRVSFRWRNFPIAEKHPHAEHAAQAAEAARAQGKFTEMHDLLFANRRALEDDDLIGYGRELGIDIADDLRSGRYADRVREDYEAGLAAGVQGTPTFFIDGKKYGGFYDVESLTWALEEAGA